MYEKISENLIEEYGNNFKSNVITTRDKAFICYYLIKKGEAYKVVPFIADVAVHINTGETNYYDTVFWLWILGEYLKETNDMEKKDVFIDAIYTSMEIIGQSWDKPMKNWMGSSKGSGVYITNISIAYGAIQSVNNFLRNDKAQKLLIDIRKFIITNFLKKGEVVSVVSKLGESVIYGDIGNTAAPFGLLGVEDRILVEAVFLMEKDLNIKDGWMHKNDLLPGGFTRTDINCLLSWYYSEKGDFARARWLLEQAEKIWDGTYCEETMVQENKETLLSFMIYAIAKQNIFLKQQVKGFVSNNILSIIHHPAGTEDPYNFKNTERCPRHPEAGDEVALKMVTQPLNASQEAFVEYNVNGGQTLRAEMHIETLSDGEKYWKVDIGRFGFADKVEYRFIVKEGQNNTVSEIYDFSVRQWQPIGRITYTRCRRDEISLLFEPLEDSCKVPCLRISKNNGKAAKLSFIIEDALNIEKNISEYLLYGESSDLFDVKLDESDLRMTVGELIFNIADKKNGDILKSYQSEDLRFIDLLVDKSGIVHKVRYNFLMASGEKFFGMGERYSHLQYRGQDIDNYVYNQYRDQGLRTYIPVPFSISSMNYGIYADTDMYSVFRFGTKLNDLLEIEISLNERKQFTDLFIFVGEPKEVIKEFVKITGMPKLPPKWAFGLWISSNNWDSQAEVYEQLKLSNKYKIPATALVLEQWSDEATYYIFNDAKYEVKPGDDYLRYEDYTFPEWGRWPDPKKMVEDLHAEGIKVFLWQVPMQKYMNGIAHAQRDEDERVMLKNGYHVKRSSGEPYRAPYGWFSNSLIPDFSNPKAREWWFNKRLYLLKDIGIDGFKTDGGECVFGHDLVFFDGRTGDEMRNRYPNDYIGSYHEFLKQHLPDSVTFSRAGYTGAQAFPLHWAGDERSTYKAFRASVIAGLSCSMSGIPFWGWDIAGFHGDIPTAELYVRATQMAAFCPVMQYHAETRGEFNQDRTPWNIADRTGSMYVIDIFKKYTDLRMNMIPYIYQQAVNSSLTGLPMMRAMFIEYPSDNNCIEMTQQYMFGDSLLVAPVVEEGSFIKNVYLPEGKWMNFFTGEIVPGSRFITEEADIGHIPVYMKENSIIPLNLSDTYKLFSYVGNRTDKYENLSFMVFMTDTVKYGFKDDVGNDVNIDCRQSGSVLNIDATSNYDGDYVLILRSSKNTGNITINGKAAPEQRLETLEAGSYAVDGTDIIIKVDGRAKNTRII